MVNYLFICTFNTNYYVEHKSVLNSSINNGPYSSPIFRAHVGV